METKRCENCAFYLPSVGEDDEEDYGDCRRNAPVLVADLNEQPRRDFDHDTVLLDMTAWPIVAGSDFCGEFKAKASGATCTGCGGCGGESTPFCGS